MKLKALTLTDDGTGGATPETITVEMTPRELVLIAFTLAGQSNQAANELLKGSSAEGNEIYSCLAYDVASWFFENGLDDWVKELAK